MTLTVNNTTSDLDKGIESMPVSYTNLTLPTSDLV